MYMFSKKCFYNSLKFLILFKKVCNIFFVNTKLIGYHSYYFRETMSDEQKGNVSPSVEEQNSFPGYNTLSYSIFKYSYDI